MKKIILLAFVSIVAFMSTAPASAVKPKFGGEIRFRYDQHNNADFDDSSADNRTSVNQLVRLNARFVLDERTTLFVSIQDVRNWGDEKGAATTANENERTDLDESWLRIKNALGPLTLKLGRQRLAYGNRRLISDSPWRSHGKRFDALRAFLSNEILDFDFFFSKVKTYKDISGDSNIDDHFHGLYASFKKIAPTTVWDFYIFQKKVNDPDAPFRGQNILTIGALLNGKIAFFDWSAEYAEQSGRFRKTSNGDIDQDARFSALTAGCTFGGASANIRIGAELVKGTGDEQGTDDRNERFDNLFPGDHIHHGASDISVQGIEKDERLNNLKAYNFNLSVSLFQKTKFKTSYWNFAKETNSDKYGSELNFQLWHELTSSIELHAYYASYRPQGDTGEDKFERTVLQIHSKF